LYDAVRSFDAEAFTRRHGGYKESRSQASHEYLLPCAACGSSRLRWNALKGWGTWVCWGCRRSGDTLALVELLERCDELEAVDYVMKGYVGGKAPIQLDASALKDPRAQRQRLTRLPQIPWPMGVDVLGRIALHEPAWRYLSSRGLTHHALDGYRLGWGRSGWLAGYLVFPCYMDGGMVYWQGRQARDPTTGPKTLNPRAEPGMATAADVLFNYERARTADHVVVCEGPIDALKIGPHAVALLGKATSPAKIERLLRMRTLRYTVYFDAGDEERECAERLAAQLSAFATTYIAEPPAGYDPGALTVEQNAHVIARARQFRKADLSSNLAPRIGSSRQ
jgi:DNA primase